MTQDFNLDRDLITLYVDFERPTDERHGYYDAVVGYKLILADGISPVREMAQITLAEYDAFINQVVEKSGVGVDGLRHLFEVFNYRLTTETHATVVTYNGEGNSLLRLGFPIRDKGKIGQLFNSRM